MNRSKFADASVDVSLLFQRGFFLKVICFMEHQPPEFWNQWLFDDTPSDTWAISIRLKSWPRPQTDPFLLLLIPLLFSFLFLSFRFLSALCSGFLSSFNFLFLQEPASWCFQFLFFHCCRNLIREGKASASNSPSAWWWLYIICASFWNCRRWEFKSCLRSFFFCQVY